MVKRGGGVEENGGKIRRNRERFNKWREIKGSGREWRKNKKE